MLILILFVACIVWASVKRIYISCALNSDFQTYFFVAANLSKFLLFYFATIIKYKNLAFFYSFIMAKLDSIERSIVKKHVRTTNHKLSENMLIFCYFCRPKIHFKVILKVDWSIINKRVSNQFEVCEKSCFDWRRLLQLLHTYIRHSFWVKETIEKSLAKYSNQLFISRNVLKDFFL